MAHEGSISPLSSNTYSSKMQKISARSTREYSSVPVIFLAVHQKIPGCTPYTEVQRTANLVGM